MARRHTELVRRFSEPMYVSSVATSAPTIPDPADITISRQPFPLREAKLISNELRWSRSIVRNYSRALDVLHCGEIRPVGYAVWLAARRMGIPYLVYVNGGDLLRERAKTSGNPVKRLAARHILGDAIGIVANSQWCASLTRDILHEVGARRPPAVAAIDLGTDPEQFHPRNDTGRLRAEWSVGDAPLLLTVARLVPHKGQDTAIKALAALSSEFPTLRYVIVGAGDDRPRLEALARSLGVLDRVHFPGPLRDDSLPEAYATSTVYVGPSRLDRGINVEGFGIAFVEAAASALPVVAGDSGGVRSAVRDGETGFVVPAEDADAFTDRIGALLRDKPLRDRIRASARASAESHYNWDRVARETLDFVHECMNERTHDRRDPPSDEAA